MPHPSPLRPQGYRAIYTNDYLAWPLIYRYRSRHELRSLDQAMLAGRAADSAAIHSLETGRELTDSSYAPLEKGPEPCYSGRCAGCGMLLVSAVRPIDRGTVCGRHCPGRRPDVA